jgi:hypothetical protein
MFGKLVSCLVAGAVGATIALTPPASARGGGFGGGGFGGGGMHGGGMHGGGMGGGMHVGGMGGGMHVGGLGAGARFGGIRGGMRFAGSRFASGHFARPGFSPRFSRFAFRDHRFFRHRRFNSFAFVGAPFLYAGYYDGCWSRTWTSYGPQWVNVCGYY